MNKKGKISLGILVVLILMIFSVSMEATAKSKMGVGKEQRITVMAIDSEELNFCGNRAGGFAAKYQGKTIRIVFGHDQHASIVPGLKGSLKGYYDLLCTQKLSFVNKLIDVIGYWVGKEDGVDQFHAKKIFIPQK